MQREFLLLFIGFLFVYADFTVNGLLLFFPDFLGYLIIAFVVGRWGAIYYTFKTAQTMAMIMFAFTVLSLFPQTQGWASQQWVVITGDILYYVMLWNIMDGIVFIARESAQPSVASTAHWIKIVTIFALALSFAQDYILSYSESLNTLLIPLLIAFFIGLKLFILIFLLWAGKRLPSPIPIPAGIPSMEDHAQ